MSYFLFFCCLSVALVSFMLCIYTLKRVAKLQGSLKGLDWESLGTLTGDIGALKSAYQRLNNRLSGMATVENRSVEQQALQVIQNQQNKVNNNTTKRVGG